MLSRLGSLFATLVVMSFIIFLLVEIMPGDVAQMILGQSATKESVQALRAAKGLDDPLLVRYGRWMGGILRGDLGESLYMKGGLCKLHPMAPGRQFSLACIDRVHILCSAFNLTRCLGGSEGEKTH